MINLVHLVHVYAQGKVSKEGNQVRQSPKVDSEKNTELPRTGFELVTTGLLVQCSAN